METAKRQKKVILGMVGVFAIICIAIIVYSIFFLDNSKTKILIKIVPSPMTLELDGDKMEVKYDQTIAVSPGKHDLTFSRDGFETKKLSVEVPEDQTVPAYVLMNPLTDAARAIMNTDTNDLRGEEIVGGLISQGGDKLSKEDPIIDQLPIQEEFYSITSCKKPVESTNKKSFAICIDAFDKTAYDKALADMVSQGFKPEDYEIIDLQAVN